MFLGTRAARPAPSLYLPATDTSGKYVLIDARSPPRIAAREFVTDKGRRSTLRDRAVFPRA